MGSYPYSTWLYMVPSRRRGKILPARCRSLFGECPGFYRNAEGASFRPETLRQQDGRLWTLCLRDRRLKRALESGVSTGWVHPPKGSGATTRV